MCVPTCRFSLHQAASSVTLRWAPPAQRSPAMFSAPDLVDDGNEPSALNEPSSGIKLEQDDSMTSPKKEESLGVAAADIITSPGKDGKDAEPMDAASSEAPDGVPGTGVEGHGGSCGLCNIRQRANKQKYCRICKSDIQAARREADAKADTKEYFQKLLRSGGPDFLDFMHEFVKNSGMARRKFSQRAKFDFARYREARRVQTAFRLGFKARWTCCLSCLYSSCRLCTCVQSIWPLKFCDPCRQFL